ncbi:N-acetylmuramoyl-L-alanine amidase [Haloechinothrix sp. LS1_15]|uniref:peptidoglycan recognition protein family protein n=1 Tax=Haloechinothrix sp. LS1_15 TaxID=2652248 RepID=UPI002947E388|nr:N-acetylmuramoyl-L-alanine amidase [Haloechinothrix sp. LS1_15]MDV6011441.1 N-acetylmuramoyl-L-alanine amidase [Haloechinothrix sp. LS1_15]
MAAESRHTRRWALRGGLTLLAGVAGGATAVPSAVAQPSGSAGTAAEPQVFGTERWLAREPAEPVDVASYPPSYIVVHHTVNPGNNSDFTRRHAFRISRSIQDFHMDSRGWIDSGQQFTISRGGHITEGRHRSLEILRGGRHHVVGNNVGGHNDEVIGIENEGDYRTEDVPDRLWSSLCDLVTYIADRYGIPPERIAGHRDFNTTACPGDVLYARLDELRAEVGRRLGRPVRGRPARSEWPLLRPGDQGEQVRVAQRLLRDHGARDVEPDGVFGEVTRDAVVELGRRYGAETATCCGSTHGDEPGMLGADLWPKLAGSPRM